MIDDKVLADFTAHAMRDFPRECCGLIVRDGALARYIECDNIAEDPEASFLVDPAFYLRHADNVLAVAHSHPNRSPEPSRSDIECSERARVPYLILSVPSGELRCYEPKGTAQPYEGRPFIYCVSDCLSVVLDWYRQELKIDIDDAPRLPYGWWDEPERGNVFVEGFTKRGFVRVESPKLGDVIIMQLAGRVPNHAAVYLGNSLILHHPGHQTSSRVENYGNFWRKNTITVLRHENN